MSAKELTSLILDEERLRAERSDRKSWKSRVTGIEEYGSSESSPPPRRERPHRAQRADEEDAEYKLAIEASKHQEEEDRKKRQSRQGEPDDDDLAKAIKLSKEEEDLRLKELEDANAQSLFDDDPVQMQGNQPQFTGYNQGYQQQGAVDWSGNPIDMSQGQQPNYLNSYATGYPQQQQAPQQNAYQTGYQNGFPSFDQYVQQQQAQQSPFPQSQNYNPYAQQAPQQQQQQQQQPEPIVPANTNNPWATSAQTATQAQAPAATGSNNPFATSRPAPTQTSSIPTLSSLQEQKTLSSFNQNQPQFSQPSSFTPPPQQQQAQQQQQKQQSPYEARLASLLESGDGMDTFGNTGNLRIPAQHTAPGTFVNSAGAGLPGLNAQQTGAPGGNPFMQSQFTGMPQTIYGAQGVQHAQTGGGDPFGRQQGQGGGNLIDF